MTVFLIDYVRERSGPVMFRDISWPISEAASAHGAFLSYCSGEAAPLGTMIISHQDSCLHLERSSATNGSNLEVRLCMNVLSHMPDFQK